MGIPTYEDILLPLLKHIADGQEHSLRETEEKLISQFDMTEEEKNRYQPSGGQKVFFNRLGWSKTSLKKAGLVESPKWGVFIISQRGKDVLSQNPEKIDIKFLNQFPEHLAYMKGTKSEEEKTTETTTGESQSPEDMMENGYIIIRENLESEILSKIKESSPRFFEELIVDLIKKMGYGIEGQVIGKTGDGGVDGLIKEDKLGLDTIFLQAKRWENHVGAKHIRDFAGALQSKKSKKGIFITTSEFSADAKQFVKEIENRIILIDGEQLASYMTDYDVGVKETNNYKIKRIDEDYFLND